MADPFPKLRFRVMNRVFESGQVGTEVIRDFPHAHRSKWTISSIPLGSPASVASGKFEIPMPAVQSDEYRGSVEVMNKLARGQRVEGYFGPVGAGAPTVTGIIDRIGRKLTGEWLIEGKTDLWIAQMSRVFPGETGAAFGTYGGQPAAILKEFMGANELQFGDIYTGSPFVAGNYISTNVPGGHTASWAAGTDPVLGLPTATASGGGAASALALGPTFSAPTLNGNSNRAALIRVAGTAIPTPSLTTDGQVAGTWGIAYGTDGNNVNVYYFTLKWRTATGTYDIDVHADFWFGGSLLKSFTATTAMTGIFVSTPPGYFSFELEVASFANPSGSNPITVVTLNGMQVLTTTYVQDYSSGGKVGPFFSDGTSGGATIYATSLGFFTRYNAAHDSAGAPFIADATFAGPTLTGGPSAPSGPTFLDMWGRAQDLSGQQLHYTPQAMTAGSRVLGKVAFGATLGTDWSKQFEFREGDDLIDVEEDNAAEGYATELDLSDQATVGSGGAGRWSNLAAIKSLGVLSDQIPSVSGRDFASLLAASQRAAGNTSSVMARRIRVPLTVKTVLIRELDTVGVHCPSLGLYHQPYPVVSRTIAEEGWIDFFVSALPFADPGAMAARMFNGVDRLAATFATR
jgi:hypothetical protein